MEYVRIISVVLSLCILAASMFISWILINKSRRYKALQKALLQEVERRTRCEYNKIGTLNPPELMKYLSQIFSRCIELEASSRVSERDPIGSERLYALAVSRLIDYLGPETMDAIDYYYGGGYTADGSEEEPRSYVERWASLMYPLLMSRGIIKGVVNSEIRYEQVASSLE